MASSTPPSACGGGRRISAARVAAMVGAVALVVVVLLYLGVARDGVKGDLSPAPAAGANLNLISRQFDQSLPGPGPAHLQLSNERTLSRWAQLLRPTEAHSRPGGRQSVARLVTHTPEGADSILLVLEQRRLADGTVWVRVRLPILPNNSTGWVDRDNLGSYHVVHTELVVDRAERRITLYRDGRRAFTAAVGVGRSYWPTPAGHFFIREKLTRFASAFYGPLAFGTSARSAVLTDWLGGGFIGIHGTDQPQLIPGAISHGCIRLANPELLRLNRMLPVGTPLLVM